MRTTPPNLAQAVVVEAFISFLLKFGHGLLQWSIQQTPDGIDVSVEELEAFKLKTLVLVLEVRSSEASKDKIWLANGCSLANAWFFGKCPMTARARFHCIRHVAD